MGVNISGKGVLAGLASLAAGVANTFTLLASRILGFTYTGGGGSSYYTTTVGARSYGFVGMNNFGTTAYSSDGVNWQYGTNLDSLGDYYFGPVKFYNNKYVAIGQDFYSGLPPIAAVSSDGVNWTTNVLPTAPLASQDSSYGNYPWNTQVGGINDRFVIISKYAEPMSSTDGINWTVHQRIENKTNYFLSILEAIGNEASWNYLAYVTNDGYRALSNNGYDWYTSEPLYADPAAPNSNNLLSEITSRYSEESKSILSFDNSHNLIYEMGTGGSARPIYTTGIVKDVHKFDSGVVAIIVNDSNNYHHIKTTQDFLNLNAQWTTAVNHISNATNYRFNTMFSNTYLSFFDGSSYVTDDGGYSWNTSTSPSFKKDLSSGYVGGNTLESGQLKYITYDATGSGMRPVKYSDNGIDWLDGTSIDIYALFNFQNGLINNFQEIQVSIGNQGSEGAEILAPVEVYVVPVGKTTDINQVTIKNNSSNTITYDLGVLDTGVDLTDQNALINDQVISAGSTATVTSISNALTAGQKIVVLPSAVDVVEVKVYGTES